MNRTEEFATYLIHHVPEAWQVVLHECKAGNVPAGLSDEELTNTFAFAQRVLTAAIRRWWSAWQQHPDFERCDAIAPQQGHNPTVVGVWTHEPAIEYLEESFVVAPLNDVLSPNNLEWGEKHVGEFDRIEPVPDYIPVNGMRFTYKSHSFRGRGSRAWYAREILKDMLPYKLRTTINQARRVNARPKWHYLKREAPDADHKDRSTWPAWYRDNTKADLFLQLDLEDEERRLIKDHMVSLRAFWECATGRVHPHEVHEYVKHQRELFERDKYERTT